MSNAAWTPRTPATRDELGDAFGHGTDDLEASGPDPDDAYLRRLYPEVDRFAEMMRLEMWRNRRKGGRVLWRQEPLKQLVGEVFHHVAKLDVAALRGDPYLVVEHAADVANCALHVADALDLLD